MNFERHQPPLRTLGIGRAQQRVFSDIEEVVQWAYLFPSEYTRGIVDDWFGKNPQNGLPFFSIRSQRFNEDALIIKGTQVSGKFVRDPEGLLTIWAYKIPMIQWMKANIHFEPYSEANIGIRDCKEIMDSVEKLILQYIEKLIETAYNENKSNCTRKK